MANNTILAVPSGSSAGDIIRNIDRAGVKTQVIQLDVGGAAAESLVSSGNPMPVSGTVTISAALPTGANTIGAVNIAAAQTLSTVTTVTNLSQLGGAAIAMGSGVTGTGVQRVVLATDVALPTGANVIGALTANQSVNNAQIAGVAVSTGSGVTGTGVQRVTLATDVALPVGANVIGGVTVADTTASGTLTAAAQTVVLTMTGGMSAASAQITGTWVGTITFEGTVDGTNWVAVNGVFAGTSTPGSTITANGIVRLTPGGLTSLRLNMTAFTSGSAVITMRGGRGAGGTFLNQSLTAGANIIGKVGIDQTTPGTTNLVALAPASATYSASIVGLATAVAATDIFTITGSATKTVRVSRILVNGVQTTAAQVNVLIVKRSTANSAGTSTAPTRVAYDSTSAAATATVLAYTANPTLGTTLGTASASRAFIPGAATASDAQGLIIQSGDFGQQAMTLRGVAEVLAVNLNATTVTGSAINVTIEWTES